MAEQAPLRSDYREVQGTRSGQCHCLPRNRRLRMQRLNPARAGTLSRCSHHGQHHRQRRTHSETASPPGRDGRGRPHRDLSSGGPAVFEKSFGQLAAGLSDWLMIRVAEDRGTTDAFPKWGGANQAMIAFCTRCWAEINDRDDLCPLCGADQASDSRTYDQKIVAALQHPLPQVRARICWLVGENRIHGAVPRLMEIAESDPDIYVQKAAVEALGAIGDRRAEKFLRSISESANRFLAIAANESLKAGQR